MAPKVLIIYWHNEPKSFCASMKNAAVEALQASGAEVQVTDLWETPLDPITSRKNFKEDYVPKSPEYLKIQMEEPNVAQLDAFIPEIKAEQEKLAWADLVIFQFPLYWFSFPAALKGWCDRVLAMGVSYGGPEHKFYGNGVYKGKKAVLSLTTGGPQPAYQDGGFNGEINGVLRPINRGILEFCGWTVLKPEIQYAPAHISDEERKANLEAWKGRVVGLLNEEPFTVGNY